MNKPTPRYDEVSKEAKWVNDRVVEFAQKYPDWDKYLTEDHVVWKAQIDYQMSISDNPGVRRSYMKYFTSILNDLDISTAFPDDNTKEQKIQLKKIRKSVNVYAAIRRIIIEKLSYHNYYVCGCSKCKQNRRADDFISNMPFVCRRCRKVIQIWKMSMKESLLQGHLSKAGYEAKLNVGIPEHYFRPFKEDSKNTLSDDVKKKMK